MNPMAIAQSAAVPTPTAFSVPTSPAVNTSSSVMIPSAPSSCDSVTAMNQKNAIQKIVDFLTCPHPVGYDDIYTDLTEQLITQTRKDKTLSSSELTFNIFKYKVKINIFDTKKQQLSFLDKMSTSHTVYEGIEIKGGVYSHNRRQAIIDYYGSQPDNPHDSETITSREMTQLQKMSERDMALTNNNYDFLFLKYLNSIILASDLCSDSVISPHNNQPPFSSSTLKNKTQQVVYNNNANVSSESIQKTAPDNNETNIFTPENNTNKNPEIISDSLTNAIIENINPDVQEDLPSSSSEEVIDNNYTKSTNAFSDVKINVAISASLEENTASPVDGIKNNDIQQENINSMDSTPPDAILVNYQDREGVISVDLNENLQIPIEEFKNVKAEMIMHRNSSNANINSKNSLSLANKKTKMKIQPDENKNREKSLTDPLRDLIFTWKSFTDYSAEYITETHNTNDADLFLWNLSRHIFSAHTVYANGITYDADSIYLHLKNTDRYKEESHKLNLQEDQEKFIEYLKNNFMIEHAIKCETVKEGSASKKTDKDSFEIKEDHNPTPNNPFAPVDTSSVGIDTKLNTDTLHVVYGKSSNKACKVKDDCSDSVPPRIVSDDADSNDASDSITVESESESDSITVESESDSITLESEPDARDKPLPKKLVARRSSKSSLTFEVD